MEKPKGFVELGSYVKDNGPLQEKTARKIFSEVSYFSQFEFFKFNLSSYIIFKLKVPISTKTF